MCELHIIHEFCDYKKHWIHFDKFGVTSTEANVGLDVVKKYSVIFEMDGTVTLKQF